MIKKINIKGIVYDLPIPEPQQSYHSLETEVEMDTMNTFTLYFPANVIDFTQPISLEVYDIETDKLITTIKFKFDQYDQSIYHLNGEVLTDYEKDYLFANSYSFMDQCVGNFTPYENYIIVESMIMEEMTHNYSKVKVKVYYAPLTPQSNYFYIAGN